MQDLSLNLIVLVDDRFHIMSPQQQLLHFSCVGDTLRGSEKLRKVEF